LIDLEAHHEQTGGKNPALTVAVPQQAATERVTVEREATAQDIPTLQSRSLSGFAVTFTDIPIPKKGDLDEAGLGAYTQEITSQLELSQIGVVSPNRRNLSNSLNGLAQQSCHQ